MGKWDDDDEYESKINSGNIYLDDSKKGLELISRLLCFDKSQNLNRKNINRLDYLLDKELLFSLNTIHLTDELEMYNSLQTLSDKLFEQHKLSILKGKSIIGVGGKFSSGKSCFLNSLLGEVILPEDQDETTSIPTYIVHDKVNELLALTYNNQKVLLDDEAICAMSHLFKRKYGLGFANYVRNIILKINVFSYKNIALLDTPGYNKNDQNVVKAMTDAEKAREQLKTVDYLIWLVDIENGIVQQKDIEFIQTLRISTPILFVLNKAGKKTEDFVRSIIETSKTNLMNSCLSVWDVIGYDSVEIKESFNGKRLREFLTMVNNSENENDDIVQQIKIIVKQIETQILDMETKRRKMKYEIGDVIFRSKNILEIRTLTELYASVISEIEEIHTCKEQLKDTNKKIMDHVKMLGL